MGVEVVDAHDLEDGASIRQVIEAISIELLASQATREADNRAPVFEVDGLDITLTFVVTRSSKIGGGIDLKVLTAGMDRQNEKEFTQSVVLRLRSAAQEGAPAARGWDVARPVRPKIDL